MKQSKLLLFLLLTCGYTLSAQTNQSFPLQNGLSSTTKFALEDVALIGTDVPFAKPEYWRSNELPDPCAVFIGVGTTTVEGQLEVRYTLENTPAKAMGIKAGDVILDFDRVPLSTREELEALRDKHQPGDEFTLHVLREGAEFWVKGQFKVCSAEEQAVYQQKQAAQLLLQEVYLEKKMAELEALENVRKNRPILGIYPDLSTTHEGVLVKGVISGTGANAAGILPGDVIYTVDGKSVAVTGSIGEVLASHQVGDIISVGYIRDAQMLATTIKLSADGPIRPVVERDPCKVFIGVYTSFSAANEGLRVTEVIEGTPAEEAGIKSGDIVLALDGVPVSSQMELVAERDKHQPGENFQLQILRKGLPITIEATFSECPNTAPVLTETPVEERQQPHQAELQLINLNAFPNPTDGPLTVRFEAEAVPTTVRITDVVGKLLYTKTMKDFSGQFNEQINLFGQTPGVLTLSIEQRGKTMTKGIALLPRA